MPGVMHVVEGVTEIFDVVFSPEPRQLATI